MKYCSECGTKILDNAKFCINCGMPLAPYLKQGEQRIEENLYSDVAPEKIKEKGDSLKKDYLGDKILSQAKHTSKHSARKYSSKEREMGSMEKKGRKGMLIGFIVCEILYIGAALLAGSEAVKIGEFIVGILGVGISGAAYGFGITFGREPILKWASRGLAISGEITFLIWIKMILSPSQRGKHLTQLFVYIPLVFCACFMIGAFIGMYKGVKIVREERREYALNG